MPLNQCLNGRGWRWGAEGKPFSGVEAKKKALLDGLAKLSPEVEDVGDVQPLAFDVEISKREDDKQYVFGWANVSMGEDGTTIVDSHNDTISLEELENAAYQFTLSYNDSSVGEMHEGDAKGRLIESFLVTPEKLEKMGLKKDALPLGWWVGMHVEDPELFAKVKSGEYRAFSIQGHAHRSQGE